MTTYVNLDDVGDGKYDSLSQHFAEVVTGKGNDHIIVIIVGAAGKGKSYFGLDLAINCAKAIGKIQGKPASNYFQINPEHMAIINPDDVKHIFDDPKQHSIIFGDDLGIAWNARRSQNDFNIFLNDILQSFRPNHNIVIITVQSDFLVDKVPRKLAHWYIEMEQKYTSLGVTSAKVFKTVMKHRKGKTFYEYPKHMGYRYMRYVSEKVPEDIAEQYEQRRQEARKKWQESKEAVPEKDDKLITRGLVKLQKPAVDRLWKEEGYTKAQACAIIGMSTQYYDKISATTNQPSYKA
jgi:hypothetical protein